MGLESVADVSAEYAVEYMLFVLVPCYVADYHSWHRYHLFCDSETGVLRTAP